MDIILTYAVPVNVVDLGASLKAYVDTLPTVNTLRLCNCFGKGPNAFITKMPVELVKAVETHVVKPARAKVATDWERDFRCFQQECSMTDYLSREEKFEIYYDYMTELSWNFDDDIEEPSDAKLERVVPQTIGGGYIDSCHETHYERRGEWAARIEFSPTHGRRGFLVGHEALVAKHFGVDLWISHVRLRPNNGEMGDDDPTETTVAYLTMPGNKPRSQHWTTAESEEDSLTCGCESGYGIPLLTGDAPLKESLRRFACAMQTLDLEVFIHPSQKGQILAPPTRVIDGSQAKDAYATTSWPQLTLLTRTKPHG